MARAPAGPNANHPLWFCVSPIDDWPSRTSWWCPWSTTVGVHTIGCLPLGDHCLPCRLDLMVCHVVCLCRLGRRIALSSPPSGQSIPYSIRMAFWPMGTGLAVHCHPSILGTCTQRTTIVFIEPLHNILGRERQTTSEPRQLYRMAMMTAAVLWIFQKNTLMITCWMVYWMGMGDEADLSHVPPLCHLRCPEEAQPTIHPSIHPSIHPCQWPILLLQSVVVVQPMIRRTVLAERLKAIGWSGSAGQDICLSKPWESWHTYKICQTNHRCYGPLLLLLPPF